MDDLLEDDFDNTMKVIVVGNGRVGKTSLVRQFATGKYDENYKQTIGVSFTEKEMFVKDIESTITFMLWDTAGQEEFAEMTKQYYRGAKACVLAFSTTDRDSFEAIEEWNAKVLRECDENICRVLIQNKIDLLQDRQMEEQEAEQLATKLNVKFYRMSVKNNFNVDNVFTHLAVQYMKQKQQQQQDKQQSQSSNQSKRQSTNQKEDDFTDRPFNLDRATQRVEAQQDKKKRQCC